MRTVTKGALALSLVAMTSFAACAGDGQGQGEEPAGEASGALVTMPSNSSQDQPDYEWGDNAGALYRGGDVMDSGAVHLYFVFYGTWAQSDMSLMQTFASGLDGSPLYNVLSSYWGWTDTGAEQRVSNRILLLGSATDPNYSQGKALNRSDISRVVHRAIYDTHQIPEDPMGVYVVAGAADVEEGTFGWGNLCEDFCAFHYAGDGLEFSSGYLKVAFLGNPNVCHDGNHPSNVNRCDPKATPNGNFTVDAMANMMWHEVAETIMDPAEAWGWETGGQGEIGDYCDRIFGTAYTAPNGQKATQFLGGKDWYLQEMWQNEDRGGCVQKLHLTRRSAPPSGLVAADLDGNGITDIVWRDTTFGGVSTWLLSPPAVANTANGVSSASIGSAQSASRLYGIADFDGDGRSDILWHSSATGDAWVWQMNGATIASQKVLTVPGGLPLNYQINAVGDFDGRWGADLLIQDMDTNATYLWFNGSAPIDMVNGTLPKTSIQLDTGADWVVAAAADVDGDGRSDIIWHDEYWDQWWVWRMNGTTVTQSFFSDAIAGRHILGAVDVDGDHKAELIGTDGINVYTVRLFPTEQWIPMATAPSSEWEYAGAGTFQGPGTAPRAGVLWRSRRTGAITRWLINPDGTKLNFAMIGSTQALNFQVATN